MVSYRFQILDYAFSCPQLHIFRDKITYYLHSIKRHNDKNADERHIEMIFRLLKTAYSAS